MLNLDLDGVIEAWDEFVELLRQVADALADLANAAYDAHAVDKRAAEYKKWGHPPRKLVSNYQQPMKKVKPNARSCTHKRGGQRRE